MAKSQLSYSQLAAALDEPGPSRDLNAQADEITKRLLQTESRLQRLAFKLPVAFEDPESETTTLIFDREGNHWVLSLVVLDPNHGEQSFRIQDAPLSMRHQMAVLLPGLLQQMHADIAARRNQLRQAAVALRAADDLLNRLEKEVQ